MRPAADSKLASVVGSQVAGIVAAALVKTGPAVVVAFVVGVVAEAVIVLMAAASGAVVVAVEVGLVAVREVQREQPLGLLSRSAWWIEATWNLTDSHE